VGPDGTATCSIHGSGTARTEGQLPPEGSPALELANAIKGLAAAAEFQEKRKAVTLTFAVNNPYYRFDPLEWAVETLGWIAIVIIALAAAFALVLLYKVVRRLRRRRAGD
jgi:hypothetical protein